MDVYVCGITWQHELDSDVAGYVKIYPNVNELRKDHPMSDECGIVKVRLEFVEWVEPQNLFVTPPVPASALIELHAKAYSETYAEMEEPRTRAAELLLSDAPTAAYEVERDYSSDDEVWFGEGLDRDGA